MDPEELLLSLTDVNLESSVITLRTWFFPLQKIKIKLPYHEDKMTKFTCLAPRGHQQILVLFLLYSASFLTPN